MARTRQPQGASPIAPEFRRNLFSLYSPVHNRDLAWSGAGFSLQNGAAIAPAQDGVAVSVAGSSSSQRIISSGTFTKSFAAGSTWTLFALLRSKSSSAGNERIIATQYLNNVVPFFLTPHYGVTDGMAF
jgi:hypothetical protein